jgi:asparagine synthase (glutamine-hydrolysing)
MCGIIGVLGLKVEDKIFKMMLNSQSHRGPDSTGIYHDENIQLGHNRLSIIDLSEEANQPFKDNSNRYIIVFNGEIYNYLELREELNYSFKTASDTEVLLAAYITWGEKCLNRLNGMFAFAIWDNLDKTLFAARDRFGVKPFYYTFNNDRFYFASEIKALHTAGIPKKMNKKVWANYLVYGSYGMPNESFWEDIHQIPGGHSIICKNDKLEIKRWYSFEKEILKFQNDDDYESVKSQYTALLADSINLRFRSDVPIGFNVSGGLDSSALLAFVNKQEHSANIKAYTFYTDDERYDELPWVEKMISITGNPLEKVLLESRDVSAFAQHISTHQDEPYGGVPTIAYAQIFKKAREQGVKVLLDGQGMDEQWAGYDYYLKNDDYTIQGVTASPFRKNVLTEEFIKLAEKPNYPKPFNDAILNLQYRDLFYTKIPRALRFNDRISMTYSTELREPFLDYRLVEFAFAQPLEYKIKGGIQKFLLRDIVAENLSDTIAFAPKRALQTPQREWLANELEDWVKDVVCSMNSEWFDKDELNRELNLYFEGNQEGSFHIWQWVNLALILNQ